VFDEKREVEEGMDLLTGVVAWGEEENSQAEEVGREHMDRSFGFEMEVLPEQAGSLPEHGTGWGC
jgi:hypothetical protein